MNPIDVNFVDQLQQSISLFLPETVLTITFVLALMADIVFKKIRNISAYIAVPGYIITAILMFSNQGINEPIFSNMIVVDPFAQFFKFIILGSSVIVTLMSFFSNELNTEKRSMGEYYSLMVGMTLGMFLLAEANNLIMIYLAIETMSISSYVLTGYTKEINRSSEASLKYVIFGSVASGIMIYGISILFGLTGSLNLYELNQYLISSDVNTLALAISGLMIIGGFGYKISAVPFHFWTPDVYEGAPVTITAYLSVASKAAGFAVMIRFLKVAFIDPMGSVEGVWSTLGGVDWQYVVAILAVITMTLGNLAAIWQENVKRLLAYSSIAHAGYLLMGVVVMTEAGISGIMVYFVAYLFMNFGAFLVVMLIANKTGSEELEDYQGIGYQAPVLAVCMTLFLVSLTGLPPTAGFIGKFAIFTAVIDAGWIWLAVVGILNSVVSLFYYVKIFRNMFVRNVHDSTDVFKFSPASVALVIAMAIPTLLFGLYWSPLFNWAKSSVAIMTGM